jgi:3',5'-cyclic AMP phosphodiesterase CpdA
MKSVKLLTPALFAFGLCSLGYFFALKFTAANPTVASTNNPDLAPVIAAAGDIACVPPSNREAKKSTCQMKATSDLLVNTNLAAVLPLGDLQYELGEFPYFQQSYHPTWGRVKSISRPVPGNHEYYTDGASGYYTYFGKIAGNPNKGYYSYDIGNWHLIALNSNCSDVSCEADSPQVQWLKQDLAAHPSACTIAYWHHPRFSSGTHGNDENLDAFWQVLDRAGVEIVLNGHDHHYERFAPQTPEAKQDKLKGIRQFVVGTGGKNLYPVKGIQPNSEIHNNETYGILKLTLHQDSYDWKFEPITGQNFTDSGSDRCH